MIISQSSFTCRRQKVVNHKTKVTIQALYKKLLTQNKDRLQTVKNFLEMMPLIQGYQEYEGTHSLMMINSLEDKQNCHKNVLGLLVGG